MSEIIIEGKVDLGKFGDIIDLYRYLPIKVKKDRNVSLGVGSALNSKKVELPPSKLLLTLAIKLEERFNS